MVLPKKETLLDKVKKEHPDLSPELELLITLLIKEQEEVKSELRRIRRWSGIPPGCPGPF